MGGWGRKQRLSGRQIEKPDPRIRSPEGSGLQGICCLISGWLLLFNVGLLNEDLFAPRPPNQLLPTFSSVAISGHTADGKSNLLGVKDFVVGAFTFPSGFLFHLMLVLHSFAGAFSTSAQQLD